MHVLKYLLTLQLHHELIILNDQDHCQKMFQHGASEVINASFLVCVVIVFERPLAGVFISIILLLDGGGISVASDNNFFFKLPSSIISFKSRPLWKKKSAVIQQCFSFFFYNFFFAFSFFFFIDKNKQRPASSIVFQNKRTCFTLKKN